jgi:hypothetical protein
VGVWAEAAAEIESHSRNCTSIHLELTFLIDTSLSAPAMLQSLETNRNGLDVIFLFPPKVLLLLTFGMRLAGRT